MSWLSDKVTRSRRSPLLWACALWLAGATVMSACGGGGGSSVSSGGSGGGTTTSSSSSSSSSSSTPFVGNTVAIDAGAGGQTISGWEVTARFWEFNKVGNAYDGTWLNSRDSIVTHLVGDAGINRVRIEVRSGIENPVDYWNQFVNGQISYLTIKDHFYEKINDNSDPNTLNAAGIQWSSFDYYIDNFVIPLKTKLAASGQKLYVNLCFVDFGWTTLKGTLSLADQPPEYAELMTAAATRLRDKYGITPDSVEIILEPDNTDKWTGSAIGQGMLALKTRLAANGITPKFVAPSASRAGLTTGILDAIGTVPSASAAINVVSYHRYDGTAAANSALAAIRSRATALGAETAMLEYDGASTTDFFRDMEYGGASAWQSYAAAYPASNFATADGGSILWRADDGTVSLTPQYRTIGLLQHEILAGAKARRLTLSSSSDYGLSFLNPDGSDVIALYSPSGNNFKITGGAKTTYLATFASNSTTTYTTQTLTKGSDGSLLVTVPANQVVLLRSTG